MTIFNVLVCGKDPVNAWCCKLWTILYVLVCGKDPISTVGAVGQRRCRYRPTIWRVFYMISPSAVYTDAGRLWPTFSDSVSPKLDPHNLSFPTRQVHMKNNIFCITIIEGLLSDDILDCKMYKHSCAIYHQYYAALDLRHKSFRFDSEVVLLIINGLTIFLDN